MAPTANKHARCATTLCRVPPPLTASQIHYSPLIVLVWVGLDSSGVYRHRNRLISISVDEEHAITNSVGSVTHVYAIKT